MKQLNTVILEDRIDERIDPNKVRESISYILSYVQKYDILGRIKNLAKHAGKELVKGALTLYFIMMSGSTPYQVKLEILGALLYLVNPVDAIADVVPGGYADDLVIITTLLQILKSNNTPIIQQQVDSMLKKWFGEEQDDL